MLKAELDALKAANAKARQEAVNVREGLNWQASQAAALVTSIDAEAALLNKVVATVPASPPPPPSPPPSPPPPPAPTSNILWQDDFQTDANFTKQLWPACEWGGTLLPGLGSDAAGASLSRVRDPADPSRWAIRMYLNAVSGRQWGRAQLSLHSGTLAVFGQQLASKGEVWVSQDIFLPVALVAESQTAWLALQDFHVHTIPNGQAGYNRLSTWPGFFMGSTPDNNCPAGRMISRHSGLVAPYANVYSLPTPVAPVGKWFTLTTRYPWPAPGVSANIEYYFDRVKVAEAPIVTRPEGQTVLEPMFKLYGEGPWSQKPIVRYLRNVMITDGLPR